MKFIKNAILLVTIGTMIFMSPAIVGFGIGLICRLIYTGWHYAWVSP